MKTEYRKLTAGDVVADGDVILHPNGKVTPLSHGAGNIWIGHKISERTPHIFARDAVCDEPAVDPVIARAKRQALAARRRTTLGRLEGLLAERALWQRKQTVAISKLAETQRKIEALARALASEKFDTELTANNPTQ